MRNARDSVTGGIGPLDREGQTEPSQAIDASAQGRKAGVPMREDRTYKNLFKHPRMLRSLLEWFVREEWVGLIEWDDPQPSLIHTEHVTDRLAVRQNDVVWQLGWKGPEARYVYLMLEFQSGVDRTMSLRMQSYSSLAQEELVCKVKVPTPLGVVVPMVLYTGRSRWTAGLSAADLTAEMQGLGRWRSTFEYLLIDVHRCLPQAPAGWNEVKALFQLAVAPPEDWGEILAKLTRRLSGPDDLPLRRSFAGAVRMMLQAEFKDGSLPDEASLEGGHRMLIEQVRIWKAEWKAEKEREWKREWKQEGKREGKQEGKQEGTRETLVAVARDRFGETAATALAARLSRISGSESLGEIRRLIVNCDSAEALLGQIEAV